VSAVKVDGKRLHQLAREGLEVERVPRPVEVTRFVVRPTADPMLLAAEITCSSGTYVRVLAADLGGLLGGGAHLASLRRVRVGPFGVDEARPLDSLQVLPSIEGVRHLERVRVDDALVDAVRHGRVLDVDVLGVSGSGPWALVQGQRLLAVYAPHRAGTAKPSLVLAPAVTG